MKSDLSNGKYVLFFRLFLEVVFEVFRRKTLADYTWKEQDRTYAVAKLIDVKGKAWYFRAANIPEGAHAEITLIRKIKEELKNELTRSRELTIYLNRAPCNDCAKALIEFLDDDDLTKMRTKIKAVDAYFLKKKEKEKLRTDLTELSEKCNLSIFNKSDWQKLYNCIQQVSFNYPKCMKEREEDQKGRLKHRLNLQAKTLKSKMTLMQIK